MRCRLAVLVVASSLAFALLPLAAASASASWRIVSISDAPQDWWGLNDVSCTSRDWCMAVGQDPNTFAIVWNGSTWSPVHTPEPGPWNRLMSISCVSRTFCVAAGFTEATGLIEEWNGIHWTIVSRPRPAAAANQLTGVSCSSQTSCAAVGITMSKLGGASSPLTMILSRGAWRETPSPEPGNFDNAPSAVSCPSPVFCVAVGVQASIPPGGTAAHLDSAMLVETWTGTAWSLDPTPTPAGASGLTTVACSTTSRCMALGSVDADTKGSKEAILDLTRDGGDWALAKAPNLGAGATSFNAVDCMRSVCFIAGQHAPADRPSLISGVVESVSAGVWTNHPVPNPHQAGRSDLLDGISCVSPSACVAVGATIQTSSEGLIEMDF